MFVFTKNFYICSISYVDGISLSLSLLVAVSLMRSSMSLFKRKKYILNPRKYSTIFDIVGLDNCDYRSGEVLERNQNAYYVMHVDMVCPMD